MEKVCPLEEVLCLENADILISQKWTISICNLKSKFYDGLTVWKSVLMNSTKYADILSKQKSLGHMLASQ